MPGRNYNPEITNSESGGNGYDTRNAIRTQLSSRSNLPTPGWNPGGASPVGVTAPTVGSSAINSYNYAPGMQWSEDQQRAMEQQQQEFINSLQNQASGKSGPSAAENMMKQGLQNNQLQQASAMAAQKGINPALAARTLSMNSAMAGQNEAGQAATMRAQEQLAAQQQLGQALNTSRGQDLSMFGTGASALGGQNSMWGNIALQQAALNQQANMFNSAQQGSLLGAGVGALSGLAGMAGKYFGSSGGEGYGSGNDPGAAMKSAAAGGEPIVDTQPHTDETYDPTAGNGDGDWRGGEIHKRKYDAGGPVMASVPYYDVMGNPIAGPSGSSAAQAGIQAVQMPSMPATGQQGGSGLTSTLINAGVNVAGKALPYIVKALSSLGDEAGDIGGAAGDIGGAAGDAAGAVSDIGGAVGGAADVGDDILGALYGGGEVPGYDAGGQIDQQPVITGTTSGLNRSVGADTRGAAGADDPARIADTQAIAQTNRDAYNANLAKQGIPFDWATRGTNKSIALGPDGNLVQYDPMPTSFNGLDMLSLIPGNALLAIAGKGIGMGIKAATGQKAHGGAVRDDDGLIPGDDPRNDVVDAKLSPGEIVLPRSIAQSDDAARKAAEFVEAIKRQQGDDDDMNYGHVLDTKRQYRLRHGMDTGGDVAKPDEDSVKWADVLNSGMGGLGADGGLGAAVATALAPAYHKYVTNPALDWVGQHLGPRGELMARSAGVGVGAGYPQMERFMTSPKGAKSSDAVEAGIRANPLVPNWHVPGTGGTVPQVLTAMATAAPAEAAEAASFLAGNKALGAVSDVANLAKARWSKYLDEFATKRLENSGGLNSVLNEHLAKYGLRDRLPIPASADTQVSAGDLNSPEGRQAALQWLEKQYPAMQVSDSDIVQPDSATTQSNLSVAADEDVVPTSDAEKTKPDVTKKSRRSLR